MLLSMLQEASWCFTRLTMKRDFSFFSLLLIRYPILFKHTVVYLIHLAEATIGGFANFPFFFFSPSEQSITR